MTSDELRKAFLEFFAQRGHVVVPSSSLIPTNDPTLLFTNAGMVQFKDVFLGLEKQPYSRATSSQKCVRAGGKHNDLDVVGRTARHHTFFEMLGNFSFGDYFKKEAIEYAWEFLTAVLKLPSERLWVTIYEKDNEAFALWQEVAGVPPERIVHLGEKDNFWAMGDTGPCGPCSEVLIDRGEELRCTAPVCAVGKCDCDRYFELWNLVFMQFERDASGNMRPLPKPSIDTGMGLERTASILQGVASNYDTDLFRPVIEVIERLSGRAYDHGERGLAFRVIADHARACAFLVGDGVLPSNEGRGYVLRRILRRAVRYGRDLGLEKPFFAEVCDAVIGRMAEAYPELASHRDFVLRVIASEEGRFRQTLIAGLNLLNSLVEELRKSGEGTISGDDAFRLYDTYGFPVELTAEVAAAEGLMVDLEGFQAALARQREQARAAAQKLAARGDLESQILSPLSLTETPFTGYQSLEEQAKALALVRAGSIVEEASEGEEVQLVASKTPFYAESGGQVGDRGVAEGPHGILRIEDTLRLANGVIVHYGVVAQGSLRRGDEVVLKVDRRARRATECNHTATHLLHAALRQVLGEHVKQSGSVVAPDRLRFDFSHFAPLNQEEKERISSIVNEHIRADLPVTVSIVKREEALETGAIALFGEKYGEEVRVIEVCGEGASPSIGRVSRELCGGTHVSRTGQIGLFVLISEGSVGANLRRIEAVTGREAERLVAQMAITLETLSLSLGVPPTELPRRLKATLEDLEAERRRSAALKRQLFKHQVELLRSRVATADGVPVLASSVQHVESMEELREVMDLAREVLSSGVIVLGATFAGKPHFVATVSRDWTAKGLHAGEIVRRIAKVTGGSGGGRPEMAQAGGKDPSRLEQAIGLAPTLVLSP